MNLLEVFCRPCLACPPAGIRALILRSPERLQPLKESAPPGPCLPFARVRAEITESYGALRNPFQGCTLIPRFECVRAAPVGKPGPCPVRVGTSTANGTVHKTSMKTMCCERRLITSACYLCNTLRETRFVGPFRSVLLLCVQVRSVIVIGRRRGASQGRPV